ncbi:MAG: hypothetical protein AAFY59_01685 [Pseudomonadota bacterium]
MDMRGKMTEAGLWCLIVLQGVMLLALYTKTPPHPPEFVAPFGIAPFLGASLALAASALALGTGVLPGRVVAVLAALAALVSYGPQKYVDAQFALIWPSVILGQGGVIAVFWGVFDRLRAGGAGAAGH